MDNRVVGFVRSRSRSLAILLLIAALAGVVATACSSASATRATSTASGGQTSALSQQSAYYGAMPEPSVSMPSITLTDTSGQEYNLKDQTKGYVTLLYTGYTNCPDVCPATMAELAGVMNQLPANVAKDVKVVFVSTDPKRDTQQVIRTWLNKFDPAFIGLRGDISTVEKLEKDLNLPLSYDAPTGKPGDYGVIHSAVVFAFTRDGVAHLEYPEGFSISDYVHDVSLLVTEGFQAPKGA